MTGRAKRNTSQVQTLKKSVQVSTINDLNSSGNIEKHSIAYIYVFTSQYKP